TSLTEYHTEKMRQRLHYTDHLVLITGLCQPNDDLERIIQKMRVDLLLHQPQLELLPRTGILLQFAHQPVQFLYHAVETVIEYGDLVSPAVFHKSTEITFGQTARVLHQRVDRYTDAAVNQQLRQHHQRHYTDNHTQIRQQQNA